MSYEEMRDYFQLLETTAEILDVRIEWSVVRPHQITPYADKKRMGLQVADAVASSFFYGVEKSRHGYTEDRYARMLKPVVYHRRGQCRGYGLKFWPGEVDQLIRTAEDYDWVRSEYSYQ